jgi:type II restriction/modification system DNA methylase subunit YeeA
VTPLEFIAKWKASTLKERSASQSHFNDLCHLLGEPTPTDADPDGTWYTFERGARKTGAGDGWADVWKRRCFAWEYKGKHKDLDAAFAQLQRYAIALENPPLLIVSDMEAIRIHTNFTNTVQAVHVITLNDLAKPEARSQLKAIFSEDTVEQFRPGVTREAITRKAAENFASLAQKLRARGFESRRVAHFMNKLLFCMFAEDTRILPPNLLKRMLETSVARPERFEPMARELFAAMKDGGNFGADLIDWFNGGLFSDDDVLPLQKDELETALRTARLDWSEIEPSIFGTLFERGLDPDKRSQLGAHYTDTQSIMRIVGPVILDPLAAEWDAARAAIESLLAKHDAAKGKRTTQHHKKAVELYRAFLHRLASVRVLDPACGSGNFLYLALIGLKNLEQRVMLEAEQIGLPPEFPSVGPETLKGIEINAYAAELARVTIWIGQIQWMLKHGFSLSKNPVLQNLNQIECRDALLNADGGEAQWPDADFIVGNPPFLGDKKMIGLLGEDYTIRLREVFKGRVPGGADLVTYWFEKARSLIDQGKVQQAGFVATNSIRGGASRRVLDRICESGTIYNAWSDEPWVVDGTAVRVSIVCFRPVRRTHEMAASEPKLRLDGQDYDFIHADLTGSHFLSVETRMNFETLSGVSTSSPAPVQVGLDLTKAKRLPENAGIAFQGPVKVGAFDIPGELARQWLQTPVNPNGRPNSDVLRPWANGMDIVRRPSDTWIIDFGVAMPESEAALYELPFEYVRNHIKPDRDKNRDKNRRVNWFRLGRTGEDLRSALSTCPRYIITPRVSKHRLFAWMDKRVMPDSATVAIARDDDTAFGILHSRFHELWALRLCTWLGVGNDPRYTPSTTFETFPFPDGLTPDIPASRYATDPRAVAIAVAARRLNELREAWLNPPDLIRRVPEVVPGYPDRLLPVDAAAAATLKARTLTNLYNQRPAWLTQAHAALDAAVATAYGWPANTNDEDMLARLLEMNIARSRR